MKKYYMKIAIKEAEKALKNGEMPVGAVVVKNNKVIGKGYNKKEKTKNALMHAEIIAIQKACKKNKDWRLNDCELYVTVEPCIMCAGACLNARIKKVFFGAYDSKGGGFGGVSEFNLANQNLLNHKIETQGEVLQQECKSLMQNFFKQKRKENK